MLGQVVLLVGAVLVIGLQVTTQALAPALNFDTTVWPTAAFGEVRAPEDALRITVRDLAASGCDEAPLLHNKVLG